MIPLHYQRAELRVQEKIMLLRSKFTFKSLFVLYSEYVASLVNVFALALNPVLAFVLNLFLARGKIQRQLVEIVEHVVIFDFDLRVVTDWHTCLVITIDLIPGDLREAAPTGDDAGPLILVNLVVGDEVATVEENDAIAVVLDHIMLDPAEASLNAKDALAAWLVNEVVQNHRICRVVAAISDVCFVVLEHLVFLNIAWCGVD